jgi:peptide deformylase
MKLPVLDQSNPALRQRCAAVDLSVLGKTAGPGNFIEDMRQTVKAHKAYGLAAPQVGLPVQIIVIDPGKAQFPFFALINPEITRRSEKGTWSEDGCLSIGDGLKLFMVRRSDEISIEFSDRYGQRHSRVATGLAARVLQHEYDHLQGVLISDHGKPL